MSGRITPQCGTDLALDFGRGVRTYRQYCGMTPSEYRRGHG